MKGSYQAYIIVYVEGYVEGGRGADRPQGMVAPDPSLQVHIGEL
jgi:hypothetical protein